MDKKARECIEYYPSEGRITEIQMDDLPDERYNTNRMCYDSIRDFIHSSRDSTKTIEERV